MPLSRREGVCSGGVYYWHDYPLADRNNLSEDWLASVPGVNEKYEFLWRRFLDELARPGEIVFTVGTTQDNLVEFASGEEDFQRRFAIDGAFIDELADALQMVCADRFSILALVRSLGEADDVRAHARFARFNLRFCGALSLPTHEILAGSLAQLAAGPSEALRLLEGKYDNGAVIKRHSHDAARIYHNKGGYAPWAECYALPEGYLINFNSRRNAVFTATLSDDRLRFSNGTAWSKL